MSTIVAQITEDYIESDYVGKEFHLEAMRNWWGWPDKLDEFPKTPKVDFQLYDDDDELYYEGWLINDEQTLTQQFVLAWAKADSGCTTIEVYINGKWEQVIG